MSFHETVHDKWCLHKGVWQTENGLKRGFVKHWAIDSEPIRAREVIVN